MNKYFKELMDRLNKSSDIPMAFKPNELVVSKEIAFAIISDINRRYNNCLWSNKIVSFPKNKYGESSRPVLVKYKDKNTDQKFVHLILLQISLCLWIKTLQNLLKNGVKFLDTDMMNKKEAQYIWR